MRLAALQQGDKVFAQFLIVISSFAFLFRDSFVFFFTRASYFSERSSCCGESGMEC